MKEISDDEYSTWGEKIYYYCDNHSVLQLLYLIHFVPPGMQILFDGLGFEMPVADSEYCVGVWFAFH